MSKAGMAALVAGVALGLSSNPQGMELLKAVDLSVDVVRSQLAARAVAVAEPVGMHVGIGAALKAVDAAVVSGAPGGFNATISNWLRGGADAHGHTISDLAEAAGKKIEEDRRRRDEQAANPSAGNPTPLEQNLRDSRNPHPHKRDTLGTKLSIV